MRDLAHSVKQEAFKRMSSNGKEYSYKMNKISHDILDRSDISKEEKIRLLIKKGLVKGEER